MVMLVACIVLPLSACTSHETATQTKEPNNQAQQESESTVDPVVLKLGSVKTSNSIQADGVKWFAEQVKERTNGAVEVQVYLDSQLGSQNEICEGIQMGTVEMYYLVPLWGNFDPPYNILTGLFFTLSESNFDTFKNSEFVRRISEDVYEQFGVYMGGYSMDGARNIWSTMELTSVEDFQGVKLRVPDLPLYINCFTALGFNTSPIAWGDCYSALQTNVVNAIEIDNNSILETSIDEVCPHVMLSQHMVAFNTFGISKMALDKLTDEQQTIIKDLMEEAGDKINADYLASVEQTNAQMQENGVMIYTPSTELVREMSDITAPAMEEYFASCNVSDEYMKLLEELRAELQK